MRPFCSRQLSGALTALAVLSAASCTNSLTPQFIGFSTTGGRPRSIVSLQAAAFPDARVIWDAGAPSEKTVPASLGMTMFSIPRDAPPGPHAVALEDASGRSAPVTYVVDGEPLRFDAPRIDRIMSLDPQFNADGTVTTTLYVQGANVDVGAVVEINGTEVATVTHKAIANHLYGVGQDDLGYPIHYFVALASALSPLAAGAKLSVAIRNLDSVKSAPVSYTLPTSAQTLDSDGDSLPDSWETGFHDGNNDGVSDSNPYRVDIFVELDVMGQLTHPLVPTTTAAGAGAVDGVRAMFAAAPFLNPYVANGINLVIDMSGTVEARDTVIFDYLPSWRLVPDTPLAVKFSTLKEQYFDHKADGDMYHYIIWAKRILGEGSGESDYPFESTSLLPGDDAVIGLDSFDDSYQTARSQAEILAHELGHNLGQRHGGRDHEPFNPNYFSVMSYAWALRTGATVVYRRLAVTCLPFYYAKPGETEVAHRVPSMINMTLDYSDGMAKDVDEASVDEVKGVCNQPVDWDADGHVGAWTGHAADANDNGIRNETIKDFANWRWLMFDGPLKNGTIP